jgi:hypothetical protein
MDSTLELLGAVALGALLPVAYQLAMTLRAARGLIATVGPRLTGAIDELSSAAASARQSLSALDAAALQRTATGVAEIGDMARKAREFTATIETAAAVGAAVAPAMAAVIRAWRVPEEPVPAETPGERPDIQ